MGGPGAEHGVLVAALLTILASALLIPETVSLRCHSHSSVLLRDRGGKRLESIITPSGTESCAPDHSACMEAAITLSAGGMSVTLIQRGCRAGHPKGGTDPPAAPSRFLHIQVDVHYCQSDQCNAMGLGLGSPSQGTAPAPSGPTQCYAGLSLSPQPHTLEQVMCDGDNARCYHGNGTLTAGKLAVPIFVWSCQAPSCAVPPSRHVGPLQLSQAGACCTGSYCNGQRALAQVSVHHKISSVPVSDNPLAYATARKDHKQPGRSHGTEPTEPRDPDDHTETDYPDRDVTSSYDRTETDYPDRDVNGYNSTELPNPRYKGDLPPSTRPRSHPTEPGKKIGHPKSTVHPAHKQPNPGAHGSQAPGLHLCPLLVVLGIACLGL
ncbi:ly6/PLAUR domain-containing protein 5-like [Gopherus evgoodei]|uniref:ly6/PLAUR domain-containing protein 5-like n=1 Tax=Gopherus evgoodei TaxID=1825980 RepID=UPI0011CEF595|nr:ly6/PLAUR domain-containing protein 5-like [Gopherus evgoodei]